MMSHGSKQGLDPQKGQKTKQRQTVVNQIKSAFPKAKKGEQGRVGGGRFNRQVAYDRQNGPDRAKAGFKPNRGGRGGGYRGGGKNGDGEGLKWDCFACPRWALTWKPEH